MTNLAGGLRAVNSGDLTVEVLPKTSPITSESADPAVQEPVELNELVGAFTV